MRKKKTLNKWQLDESKKVLIFTIHELICLVIKLQESFLLYDPKSAEAVKVLKEIEREAPDWIRNPEFEKLRAEIAAPYIEWLRRLK